MSQNVVANMVGFRLDNKNKVVEFLPKNEQLSSEKKRRAIFFNLYNYYVDKEMRLTKKEIKNGDNIYEVFQNKINGLSSCSQLSPHHAKAIVKKINFYNRYSRSNHNLMLCRRFKSLIKVDKRAELFFNLDDMFLHLVYERAKKVNAKSDVILLEKSIVITDSRENVASTLLIPSYMKLNNQTIHSDPTVKEQMDEACRVLNETDRIKQVYLIYPKHPKFTKHITIDLNKKVKLKNEEYRVKMIPYSFSFCTKDKSLNRINK